MTVTPHAAPHAVPQAAPHAPLTPYKTDKKHAESAPPTPDAPYRGPREWWLEKREILGDAPDMVRYLANECILAGVAAAAVVVALSVSGGSVGPAATAALGVAPEMSPLGITALGCVAGASAGAASAVAIYTWEEPEAVREFAIARAYDLHYAATTVAGAVAEAAVVTAGMAAGAVQAPREMAYAAAAGAWNVAAAAASGVGYVASAAAGGAQAGAGVVMTAAAGVGSWWYGAPVADSPELAFDVADAPAAVGGLAGVY